MNEETEKAEYELVINNSTTNITKKRFIDILRKNMANLSDQDIETFTHHLKAPIHV
jgi:hypothetical protein